MCQTRGGAAEPSFTTESEKTMNKILSAVNKESQADKKVESIAEAVEMDDNRKAGYQPDAEGCWDISSPQ